MEVRPYEVRTTKVCITEVRPAKMRLTEVHPIEVRPVEVGILEVHTPKVHFVGVCPTKVGLYVGIFQSPSIPNFRSLIEFLKMILVSHAHRSVGYPL
jgi:hypothetical protein